MHCVPSRAKKIETAKQSKPTTQPSARFPLPRLLATTVENSEKIRYGSGDNDDNHSHPPDCAHNTHVDHKNHHYHDSDCDNHSTIIITPIANHRPKTSLSSQSAYPVDTLAAEAGGERASDGRASSLLQTATITTITSTVIVMQRERGSRYGCLHG